MGIYKSVGAFRYSLLLYSSFQTTKHFESQVYLIKRVLLDIPRHILHNSRSNFGDSPFEGLLILIIIIQTYSRNILFPKANGVTETQLKLDFLFLGHLV